MKTWKKPQFEEVVLALEVKGYVNAEQNAVPIADAEERDAPPATKPVDARTTAASGQPKR